MTWFDGVLIVAAAVVLIGAVVWVVVRDRRARSLPDDEVPPVEDLRTKYDADIAYTRANQTYGPGATTGI